MRKPVIFTITLGLVLLCLISLECCQNQSQPDIPHAKPNVPVSTESSHTTSVEAPMGSNEDPYVQILLPYYHYKGSDSNPLLGVTRDMLDEIPSDVAQQWDNVPRFAKQKAKLVSHVDSVVSHAIELISADDIEALFELLYSNRYAFYLHPANTLDAENSLNGLISQLNHELNQDDVVTATLTDIEMCKWTEARLMLKQCIDGLPGKIKPVDEEQLIASTYMMYLYGTIGRYADAVRKGEELVTWIGKVGSTDDAILVSASRALSAMYKNNGQEDKAAQIDLLLQ